MDWVHFRIGVTKVPVKDNLKFAFASSFVIGILVHFSVLSNNLLNHDGAGAFYWPHSFVDHGRWLLKSVCSISTYFTIPWVTGILSILYLSIAINNYSGNIFNSAKGQYSDNSQFFDDLSCIVFHLFLSICR